MSMSIFIYFCCPPRRPSCRPPCPTPCQRFFLPSAPFAKIFFWLSLLWTWGKQSLKMRNLCTHLTLSWKLVKSLKWICAGSFDLVQYWLSEDLFDLSWAYWPKWTISIFLLQEGKTQFPRSVWISKINCVKSDDIWQERWEVVGTLFARIIWATSPASQLPTHLKLCH